MRYRSADRVIGRDELPPHGETPLLLAGVVLVIAVALLVAILVD